MSGPQIQNAAQAFGEATMDGYTGDDRVALVTDMRAAVTTIVRGDIVALSTSSGYCIRSLTDTGAQLLVGIALAGTTTAGNPIPIVVYGPFYGASKGTASAVTAGDLVGRSATATAALAPIGQTTAVTQIKDVGLSIGLVMANASAAATTADIFVVKI